MEFNIKKNGTLPLLKMQVVDDGRGEFDSFMSFIETSSLYFSMIDVETGSYKIHLDPAGFVEKTQIDPNAKTEYYIYYKFPKKYTNKVGRYEGEFVLKNTDGTLVLPIREKLNINIQESYGIEDVDEIINLTLSSVITSGSTILNYVLTSDRPVKNTTTVNFTHTLQTFTGDSIVITTGVTINRGEKAGAVTITLPDADYFNLTQETSFSNIQIFPIGIRAYTNITEKVVFVLPPSQPITDAILTGVQNEYISVGNNFYLKFIDPENITDAILADPENYIKVGEGMYLRFIDTPSVTLTPTQTPTQTPTITPTPTVTSSEVPIEPTPTNSETPTQTPTPTIPIVCDSFTFTGVNATTTINSAIKTTGGGWNSSAYSVETYTNPVYVTFNMSNTNIGAMGGFSVNPTFSESTYENATFGLYGENGVNLKIYENGNNVYTVFEGGNITPSDLFKVEYDGTVVNYYYNGSLVYTSLQTITQPLHIFFPLLTENEGVINVCFIETPQPSPTPTPTVTPAPITPFVSIWSADTTIELPYTPSGLYSGTIDWGDGNVSANTYQNRTHTYDSSGDYTITITGQIQGWNFQVYATSYRANIKEIISWGTLRGSSNSNGGMFIGCSNLTLTGVTDTPNLVGINFLNSMFQGCSSLTTVNNMNDWDVSDVTQTLYMFYLATNFNQDIGNWNVSGVTSMGFMFANATNFNQDLSNWCVTNIVSKPSNFDSGATSWVLPQPVWGTCPSPNPTPTPTNTQTSTPTVTPTVTLTPTKSETPTPTVTPTITPTPNYIPFISKWNVSSSLELPYSPTGFYNGTIDWGDGNVSANTYENRTHTYDSPGEYTVTITGRIEGWDFRYYGTSSGILLTEVLQFGTIRGENNTFDGMFFSCFSLNMDNCTDTPDLGGITSTTYMFNTCVVMSDIANANSWNLSSVKDMSYMFQNCQAFNSDISNWDVSNVINTTAMFNSCQVFNQNLSNWNLSKVIRLNMLGMFQGATSFNQDLSSWCVPLISSKPPLFDTNTPQWVLPKPIWGTCPSPTPTPTNTQTPTSTTTLTPTPTVSPCQRSIVVQTLWNGATSVNSNTLQLTQTSETLQIQVNDIITDNIGATSFVGIVDSDGTYTYVYTGAGGGVSFDCQFPLTFSGTC